MKKKIILIINNIISLLEENTYFKQAKWLRTKKNILNKYSIHSEEFKKAIFDLKNIISGMGSLLDLPMISKNKASKLEMETRRNYLADELHEIINKLTLIINDKRKN